MLEVQEVEVEFDRPLELPGIGVAVAPVERIDGGVVAPVDTVLEVPGQLLAGAWVGGFGLFREWPARQVAFDFAGCRPASPWKHSCG
jgi:hypothetical protein